MIAQTLVWKPDAAPATTSKKLAGPCEVSVLALKAGGGAAAVAFYDGTSAVDVIPANLKWFLDASTTCDDDQQFENSIVFNKGIFAVLEQGAGFNTVVCVAADSYATRVA